MSAFPLNRSERREQSLFERLRLHGSREHFTLHKCILLGVAICEETDSIIEIGIQEVRLSFFPSIDLYGKARNLILSCDERSQAMAYSYTNSRGRTYYLHGKTTTLKSGKQQTIYFFAKEVKEEGSLNAIPAGYVVSESKNGLPVLKRAP